MTNKLYDRAKWVNAVAFPAVITLYLTLSATWNWPYTEQVGASLGAVNLCLGALLVRSSKKHKEMMNDPANMDGYLTVVGHDEDTGLPDLRLTVTRDPNEITQENVARLKVGNPPPGLH